MKIGIATSFLNAVLPGQDDCVCARVCMGGGGEILKKF